MKFAVALIVSGLALFGAAPAKADPMETCTKVRQAVEAAFNRRDWMR